MSAPEDLAEVILEAVRLYCRENPDMAPSMAAAHLTIALVEYVERTCPAAQVDSVLGTAASAISKIALEAALKGPRRDLARRRTDG
jgi:NAD/NADP transhydrogenase alpha subunit